MNSGNAISLQAATHPVGDIEVVAFEPDLMNAAMLTETIGRNRCQDQRRNIGDAERLTARWRWVRAPAELRRNCVANPGSMFA
jgi:hypothetical protein